MCTPDGYIYSRDAIIENLGAQKKNIKRKLAAWEQQEEDARRKVSLSKQVSRSCTAGWSTSPPAVRPDEQHGRPVHVAGWHMLSCPGRARHCSCPGSYWQLDWTIRPQLTQLHVVWYAADEAIG